MRQFSEPEASANDLHSHNLRMFNSPDEELSPEEYAQCIADTKRIAEEGAEEPEQTLFNQCKTTGDYNEFWSGY